MSDEDFTVRLQRVADALMDYLGASANCREDVEEPHWSIEPVRPDASPLWSAGSSAWDATVGFGLAGSRLELGLSRHVSDDEVVESLTEICRAVIGGRLVEWRSGARSTRWRLALPDGSTDHGSTNWFWPTLPWTPVEAMRFQPYLP
ncbi:MAG: hypothetical protein LH624_14715 [Cryobacterium sp.]|nr:hypothetical protein [Cryobacterium sp.]